MDQPTFSLANSPTPRRRGRPPGARSKRSLDLARYIEATFAGQTPGQQSAAVCMVTPADLKHAKALAKEMQIIDLGLSPLLLAMVVKAGQLARALGCSRPEAWVLMAKERVDLMAYVHQKQPQAADAKAAPPATVFLIPDGAPVPELADFSDQDEGSLDFVEEIPAGARQVGRSKSDDPA